MTEKDWIMKWVLLERRGAFEYFFGGRSLAPSLNRGDRSVFLPRSLWVSASGEEFNRPSESTEYSIMTVARLCNYPTVAPFNS